MRHPPLTLARPQDVLDPPERPASQSIRGSPTRTWLAPPVGEVAQLPFGERELGGVRRFVFSRALEAGLDVNRVDDLVLAVNELATNSVRHGGGNGTLRMWTDVDAETLVCEVRDRGHINDPSAGLVMPDPNQHSGRGRWVVQRLCDLVQIHSSRSGTAVRVHVHLP